MSEVIKDSAIKLFGKTISLPRNNNNEVSAHDSSSEPVHPEDSSDQNLPSSSSSPREEVSSNKEHEAEREKFQESPRKELTSTEDDEVSHQTTEDLKSPTSSSISENPKTPSNERETCALKASKNGEQSDTTTATTTSVSKSQDKTPKKPDKILPCPRCNSMDTKFCYYNNYNVNQPRHFCKNCQRYWTAGGTMRNVPVGAGRRKNKNSSSAAHFRQILLPEPLQTPKFNVANGLHLQSGVLAFGSDSPLCDSIASSLSLGEKSPKNGFHTPKLNGFVSCGRDDDNNISVGGSSTQASTSSEKRGSHEESLNKTFQAQSFSSPNWPYPYTWNPTLLQPSYPMPFYPTQPFWGCMPISPPPSWNLNSVSPQSCVSYQNAPSPNPNSPTLGKHSRDGQKDGDNTSVLIPKTLRIDDPSEAAKSSIWSTLGIKNEKKGSSLFKAFGSKGDEEDEKNNHMVLQANPAALSRSLTFHERT